MTMRIRPAAWGWAGLAAYIVAYERWLLQGERDTLTRVFGDALLDPRRRWPTVAVVVIIVLHLFSVLLPQRLRDLFAPYDPIGKLAKVLGPQATVKP